MAESISMEKAIVSRNWESRSVMASSSLLVVSAADLRKPSNAEAVALGPMRGTGEWA